MLSSSLATTIKLQVEKSTGISYVWLNKHLNNTPLVMLHGHGADHQAFADITDKIDNHPILLIDLPGFGHSRALETHSVENIANVIEQMLINLDVINYAIIGHSFGTIVGLKLAENNPVCSKLILLNPLPRFKPIMENFYFIFGKTFTAIPDDISDTVLNSRIYKSAGYILHARQGFNRSYFEKLFYPPVIYADFKSRSWRESWLSIHEIDQFRLATNIKCPTLIMHGDRDSLTSSDNVELFCTFFPAAKLVRFKNGGHIMHREITDKVVEQLTRFVD